MPRKLRAPHSTGVVVTLTAEAAGRGLRYAEVLAEVKAKVDLGALEIPGVRCKNTRTGPRLLEIPGATSGNKADALAAKLRYTLDAADVRVSRPIKCAEVRITGLDDSVTAEAALWIM